MTYGSCRIMAALLRHGMLNRGEILKTVYDHVIMVGRNITYDRPRPLNKYSKNRGKQNNIKGKNDFAPCDMELPRDYLRPGKGYCVPENVTDDVNTICSSILGTSYNCYDIIPQELKYKLLEACFQTFNHSVPNGILHTIQTTEDVLNFYKTEVIATTPLDVMKNIDLPPNLHIQYDYHRFHPDTDTMFGGVSAFPRNSNIVTGLKYKKKYKGFTAKTSWPYD